MDTASFPGLKRPGCVFITETPGFSRQTDTSFSWIMEVLTLDSKGTAVMGCASGDVNFSVAQTEKLN
jgi:hypothetical protein